MLNKIHSQCHDDIIKPLEEKFKDCKNSKIDKVAQLSETKKELARCESEKELLTKQLQEIKTSI